ncbi:MAG: acyl-ACP--UDP-N-acetylglucosamine O-acyltransferase [Bacteriovoracaceae bacterium]
MSLIHPTAIIHEGAEIASDVEVGAYSIIGPNVKIASGCVVHPHVIVDGHTTIDENNKFYSFSCIGGSPQDLGYKGEPTEVIIGKGNSFREYVTVHRGTTKQDQKTVVGNDCLFMAHVHLGHDVIVGDKCIFANSVNLAGHVTIGNRVIIGGGTNVSQFISIGRGSYLGGATAIDRDIPVFCTAYGNRAKLKGINIVGLRRSGQSRQEITGLVDFYRLMEASALSPRAFVDQPAQYEEYKENALVGEMVKFIKDSDVGIAPFV